MPRDNRHAEGLQKIGLKAVNYISFLFRFLSLQFLFLPLHLWFVLFSDTAIQNGALNLALKQVVAGTRSSNDPVINKVVISSQVTRFTSFIPDLQFASTYFLTSSLF